MTYLLTFWLCASGTYCDRDHAIYYQGNLSVGTHEVFGLIYCEEIDAWTNMPEYTELLKLHLSPRHSCEPKGDAL